MVFCLGELAGPLSTAITWPANHLVVALALWAAAKEISLSAGGS